MSSTSQPPHQPENLSRRDFIRDSATAAAGVTVGLSTLRGRSAQAAEAAKTRSYHPEMEYHPLGKTGR